MSDSSTGNTMGMGVVCIWPPLHLPIPGFYSFGSYICIFLLGILAFIFLDRVAINERNNSATTGDEDYDNFPTSLTVFIPFIPSQLGLAWLGMSFLELWLRVHLFNDDQGLSAEGYGRYNSIQVLNSVDGGAEYVTTNEVTTSYTMGGLENRKKYTKSEQIHTNELPTWTLGLARQEESRKY